MTTPYDVETLFSEDDILLHLEREQKICDGAQHILVLAGGSERLRSQVHAELTEAQRRTEQLRKRLREVQADAQKGPMIDDDDRAGADCDKGHSKPSDKDVHRQEALLLFRSLHSTFHSSSVSISATLPTTNSFESSSSFSHPATDPGKFESTTATRAPDTPATSHSQTRSSGNASGTPAMAPPSTGRQPQRSRSAALAAAHIRPQHNRTPSHVNGLGNVAQRRIGLLNRLADLFHRDVRLRYEYPIDLLLDSVMPSLSDVAGKEVRAAAYRLLRHAIVRPPWRLVDACRQKGLDLYIVRTFLRDSRFTIEKEQALKLVRWIMDCGSASEIQIDRPLITPSVIRAMSAACEQVEERLRILYVETLAELAIHDIGLLARAGGMRPLLNAVSDSSFNVSAEISTVLLHLVDLPSSRSFFRPNFDIVSVLAGFTDASDDDDEDMHRDANLALTLRAVSSLFRSWNGLFYMCLNDKAAVKSILLALKIKPARVQEQIITLFDDLFALQNTDSSVQMDNKSSVANVGKQIYATTSALTDVKGTQSPQTNLIDSYLLVVVVILIDSGIIDSLLHIIETKSPMTKKALNLLQRICVISSHRLPSKYSHKLHALPELFHTRFAGSANGKRLKERESASAALMTIEQYTAQQLRQQMSLNAGRPRANSSMQTARLPVQVDDNVFRTLLLEANVLSTKDNAKWNVDALQTLFENVLVHPKRLEEAMRASKLVRRVLAFYHPLAMRFSVTANTQANQRYVKLGCTILQTLISSAEGSKFLAEDQLLKEIGSSLETDIMSEQRIVETLAGGYFEFLGILSRQAEGVQVMQQAGLFTALFRVVDRRRRLDITRHLMRHLDFTVDGHCRIILSRILVHRSRTLRIEAMHVLFGLVQQSPNRWLVRLLVGQLYDPVAEVRNLACELLLQACTNSSTILDVVVSMRPMLHQASHSLLLKFLSTSGGLQYLMQGDYIDREMDEWFNQRNSFYAHQVETLLNQAFSSAVPIKARSTKGCWDGSVPPHFYGELVKTPEGCDLLERKGHFTDFARFVRLHADEEGDQEVLSKLKSILWAIGNVGASRGGLSFLEAEEMIPAIVRLAQSSNVISLRGTCFFVLGLIATTQMGTELLQDANWDVCVGTSLKTNLPFAYCIPSSSFLTLPKWTPKVLEGEGKGIVFQAPSTRLERIILSHLSSLGNTIIATKASRALSKLKERYPKAFAAQSDVAGNVNASVHSASANSTMAIELFVRTLHLLNTRPLRQSVRRYMWELFEVRLDDAFIRQVFSCQMKLSSESLTPDGHSISTPISSPAFVKDRPIHAARSIRSASAKDGTYGSQTSERDSRLKVGSKHVDEREDLKLLGVSMKGDSTELAYSNERSLPKSLGNSDFIVLDTALEEYSEEEQEHLEDEASGEVMADKQSMTLDAGDEDGDEEAVDDMDEDLPGGLNHQSQSSSAEEEADDWGDEDGEMEELADVVEGKPFDYQHSVHSHGTSSMDPRRRIIGGFEAPEDDEGELGLM